MMSAPKSQQESSQEKPTQEASQWAADWLDRVVDGSNTMSPRKLSSVET
jgi:hypothetical protein